MRIVALLLVLPLCSCSLVFVRGAPWSHEDKESIECTESTIAPFVDLLFASGDGIVGAVHIAQTQYGDPDSYEYSGHVAKGVISVTAASVYALSSLYGFVATARCRNAQELLAERHREPGCTKDADCKGLRVCVASMCQDQAPQHAAQ